MINNSYEATSIFIFRVWVFAGYITIPYNQVSFESQTQLLRSGHPLWPLTTVCSLLSISNLLPRMPLATKGCEALSFRWLYEHLSVANKFTNNLHEFSCQSIIRWAEDGQSPHCWLGFVLDCRMHSCRNHSGIIRLSLSIEPMVTIIVIGLIPTSPLEVLPTSLPSIVHSNWFWASFQTIEA